MRPRRSKTPALKSTNPTTRVGHECTQAQPLYISQKHLSRALWCVMLADRSSNCSDHLPYRAPRALWLPFFSPSDSTPRQSAALFFVSPSCLFSLSYCSGPSAFVRQVRGHTTGNPPPPVHYGCMSWFLSREKFSFFTLVHSRRIARPCEPIPVNVFVNFRGGSANRRGRENSSPNISY